VETVTGPLVIGLLSTPGRRLVRIVNDLSAMLAFEIHMNGKRICIAGIGEPGVLSAILHWIGSAPRKGARKADEHASIRVGGLIGSIEEHVTWVRRDLRRGDEVVIRVIETECADKPRERERDTAGRIRSRQKRQVRRLAKSFGWKVESR